MRRPGGGEALELGLPICPDGQAIRHPQSFRGGLFRYGTTLDAAL